ncbi:MAG: ABC-ATPase domain-containing protein [Clostridium sp.]
MKNVSDLKRELLRIDGKGYKSYKDLQGEQYNFGDYILSIDHVQGDPFASPSRVRVIIDNKSAAFPKECFEKRCTTISTCDTLTRLFYSNIRKYGDKVFGSGKSGLILISKCPQQVLERTSISYRNNKIEARFEVGFPARGRSVLAKELEKILCDFIPNIVNNTLVYRNINSKQLIRNIELIKDQEYLRSEISKLGLVGFVANGSILPRESGVSQKPLKGGIPFEAPKELEVEIKLPYKGMIKGMGIKKGITLIVGGGYHGKSTLLNALELGVYNHIYGDGREYVISDNTALKVRAEDGRSIIRDDISLFISNLPNKKDTKKFSTENASGSTSQAANIVEGIEMGTNLFLIDEDTSATNFMIRDELMQRLVSKEKEPITPFIELVKGIYEQKDISTIIVVGSSGDYFDIADCVIQMDEYEPKDVTSDAKNIMRGEILKRIEQRNEVIDINFNRILRKGSIQSGPKGIKIKSFGLDGLSINKDDIDLKAVEQLVDFEQVTAIGYIMKWIEENAVNNTLTLNQLVDKAIKEIEVKGLIVVSNGKGGSGNLALPRKQEIMSAINRFRNLRVN